MTNFIFFHIYLILLISSLFIGVRAFSNRNYETPAVHVFLVSLIGISCNYLGWLRVFAGLYGITFDG